MDVMLVADSARKERKDGREMLDMEGKCEYKKKKKGNKRCTKKKVSIRIRWQEKEGDSRNMVYVSFFFCAFPRVHPKGTITTPLSHRTAKHKENRSYAHFSHEALCNLSVALFVAHV